MNHMQVLSALHIACVLLHSSLMPYALLARQLQTAPAYGTSLHTQHTLLGSTGRQLAIVCLLVSTSSELAWNPMRVRLLAVVLEQAG